MTEAYAIVDHPDFGQCAVADKDFAPGEIVFDEEPALAIYYQKDPALDRLQRDKAPTASLYKRKRAFMTINEPAVVSLYFCNLEDRIRANLLHRFHLPHVVTARAQATLAYKAAAVGCRQLRARQEYLPEIKAFTDEQLISFSLIVSANAHSLDDDAVGLLNHGTKVTHVCLKPNVAVSTRPLRDGTRQGTAKHIALRAIAKGDLLLGSYADTWFMEVAERQAYLFDNKLFDCKCQHCSRAPDQPKSEKDDNKLSPKVVKVIEQASSLSSLRLAELASQICILPQESSETWHHPLHPKTALTLYTAIADRFQALTQSLSLADTSALLDAVTLLDDKLKQWYQLHMHSDEALLGYRLSMAQALMSRASTQHDLIPPLMDLTQKLLLRAREVIEECRGWAIGHALEEEYEQTLVDLDELVNGDATTGNADNAEEAEEEAIPKKSNGMSDAHDA